MTILCLNTCKNSPMNRCQSPDEVMSDSLWGGGGGGGWWGGGLNRVLLVGGCGCSRQPIGVQLEAYLASMHTMSTHWCGSLKIVFEVWHCHADKEGNILFNDALNTFYLRLYGVRHMVKDHSDSERGDTLPPHGLLFPISSTYLVIWTWTNCIVVYSE